MVAVPCSGATFNSCVPFGVVQASAIEELVLRRIAWVHCCVQFFRDVPSRRVTSRVAQALGVRRSAGVRVDARVHQGGVEEIVLDFKRCFSFPTEEMLHRIACGEIKRRARLATPYAEHVAVRFGFFLPRVGLLKDHHDMESARQAAKAQERPEAASPKLPLSTDD